MNTRSFLSAIPLKPFLYRSISTSPQNFLKEIRVNKVGKKTTIEAVPVASDRTNRLLDLTGIGHPLDKDPINRLKLEISHTDVLILSQFLRPNGSILPPNVTGLSQKSQNYIEMLIERARRAGLLPLYINDGQHVYYDGGFHKFNVYYDSSIVGLPKTEKIMPKYKKPL